MSFNCQVQRELSDSYAKLEMPLSQFIAKQMYCDKVFFCTLLDCQAFFYQHSIASHSKELNKELGLIMNGVQCLIRIYVLSQPHLCHQQWRRGIFWRGCPGHLNAMTRTPQGVRGRQPPSGNEIYNFKAIQSIRKRIYFSRISTFFLPKKSIFSRKFRKIEHILQKFLIF